MERAFLKYDFEVASARCVVIQLGSTYEKPTVARTLFSVKPPFWLLTASAANVMQVYSKLELKAGCAAAWFKSFSLSIQSKFKYSSLNYGRGRLNV